uniref:Uncharacterized protein n=2 Tax=Noctiluca scintillans TaxID=2966 RepID=A0A7S0ZSL5_NOCSC
MAALVWVWWCLRVCAGVREYLALAPNHIAFGDGHIVEWVLVEYPQNVSSSKDVSVTAVQESVPELGAWYGLDTGGLAHAAKIVGSTMYALYAHRTPTSRDELWVGGCCANVLRIFTRDGLFSEIDLDPVVQHAVGTKLAHVSHTFDITELSGARVALLIVKYFEASIKAPADAIVGMRLDGSIVPTADGSTCFRLLDAGTFSQDRRESVFKMQFYNVSVPDGPSPELRPTSRGEQFHGNGLQRFTTRSGLQILAFTVCWQSEAVLFKDPYSYSKSEGGGKILQRFGSPMFFEKDGSVPNRFFGLKAGTSPFKYVHNILYHVSSPSFNGHESLSLFVNSQSGVAAAYEFELKVVEEDDDQCHDTVFEVNYVFARCNFSVSAQGGARSIGNGVFLVVDGIHGEGLFVVDSEGNTKNLPYSGGFRPFYDPFISVPVVEAVV